MTYKVLTDDTQKGVYHSSVCSALVYSEHILSLLHLDDDDSQVPQII